MTLFRSWLPARPLPDPWERLAWGETVTTTKTAKRKR